MGTSTNPIQQRAEQRHPLRSKILITAVAFAIFGIGMAIGLIAGNNAAALRTANRDLAAERSANIGMRSQVSALQAQVSTEQQDVAQANAKAQAGAKADYAARVAALGQRSAALDQRSASLDQRERAIKAAEGQLQASTISDSGVYLVGGDIKSGVYHTNGDGGQGGNACYFATLRSTNTSDIIDNNNFDGAETVDVSGVYALEISGPCTWVRVG